MELILNERGKIPLSDLNKRALKYCKSVDAAIAYVTDERELLAPCRVNNVCLHLWARYDDGLPVRLGILEGFLRANTPNYEIKLVPTIFHPKVIWWRGFGVYIGSANLTDSAWFRNFEAGVFLREDELDEEGLREKLEEFFETINAAAHPLTDELLQALREYEQSSEMNAVLAKLRKEFEEALRLHGLPKLDGISFIDHKPAFVRKRERFLAEWRSTLQTLRSIAERVAQDAHRPAWIAHDTPTGVQVDQFLHAYYYSYVREGHSFPYREDYETHKSDPEAALRTAMEWWKALETAPSEENMFINDWAPFLREHLAQARIARLTQEEFATVCTHVHAMREHARRLDLTLLNMPVEQHPRSTEARCLVYGRWLYGQRNKRHEGPLQVISYVLYGGTDSELPERCFKATHDEERVLPHLGISSIGEIVGWAKPTVFPPRNGRTSKALMALGFNVRIHSEA